MNDEQYRGVMLDVFRKMDKWETEYLKGSARQPFVQAWDQAVQDELLVVEDHERNLYMNKAWSTWLTRGQPLGQDRMDQVKAYYLKPRR